MLPQDMPFLARSVPEGRDLLTCKEVAGVIDVDPGTVRDMFDAGQLTGISYNASGSVDEYANRRIHRESLILWIAKNSNYDSTVFMKDLTGITNRLTREQARTLVEHIRRKHSI